MAPRAVHVDVGLGHLQGNVLDEPQVQIVNHRLVEDRVVHVPVPALPQLPLRILDLGLRVLDICPPEVGVAK